MNAEAAAALGVKEGVAADGVQAFAVARSLPPAGALMAARERLFFALL